MHELERFDELLNDHFRIAFGETGAFGARLAFDRLKLKKTNGNTKFDCLLDLQIAAQDSISLESV